MNFDYSWDNCPEHEWKEANDSMNENDVYCIHCGIPGENDPITNEVYFPAS